MRFLQRYISVVLFFILSFIVTQAIGQNSITQDSIPELIPEYEHIFQDSIASVKVAEVPAYNYTIFKTTKPGDSTIVSISEAELKQILDSLISLPISRTDKLLYNSNPLVLPLVYVGKDIHQVWSGETRYDKMLYPQKKLKLLADSARNLSSEKIVADLRTDARKYIANNSMHLYVTTMDRLPHLSSFMSRPIVGKKIGKIDVHDEKIDLGTTKIDYEQIRQIYWQRKSNAMLQFTQNYVSQNWHQGGHSNLAFLSILVAEFNYDNRKKVQWDNKIEWRAGFNSLEGDTLRRISVNDDILRYLTKFGVKASGNWYYSISGEASTTLFDNYKKINSNDYKARFLTPVRANVGIGLDYKYKKIFSLMIAPVSFKYIYTNDTINVNPNAFGIPKGENQLKQFGSSLLAQLNYSPMLNWNITSRLKFYTDYKKIEADWEIVNNFTINRFLSARLMLNPRYDNTAILKGGDKKPMIQFKELLSLGFSYRFF